MGICKKIKAQQLVEFLLVVPFMVIILGILTEYAYALNVDATLNDGLKAATSSIYSEIKPNMSKADINNIVTAQLRDYMRKNNAPVQPENNLSVDYVTIGENAVFLARYTYLSAFTLPNVYFHILPEKFNFCASAPLPAAFLRQNTYDATVDSVALDKIWSSTADFSQIDSFNASKQGIMMNTYSASGSPTDDIAFFVPVDSSITFNINPFSYYIIHWNGKNWSGDNDNPWIADLTDGYIHHCSNATSSCTATSDRILNKLSGVTSIIFSHSYLGMQPTGGCDVKIAGNTCWIQSKSNKIADTTEDGALKQELALTDSDTKLSGGNYDNKDTSLYSPNPGVQSSTKYVLATFGSLVIIYSPSLDPILPSGSTNGLLNPASDSLIGPKGNFTSHFGASL